MIVGAVIALYLGTQNMIVAFAVGLGLFFLLFFIEKE